MTNTADSDLRHDGRLREHASRGAAWTAVMQWTIRVSAFVTFVVLGRLLSPEDFGAIALASTLVLVLSALSDFGFAAYLVQETKLRPLDLSTAFWFSAATGTAFSILLVAGAWPLAEILGAPTAAPVLAAVSLSVFLDSLKSVPTVLLKRRFDFRALAARRMVAVVVGQVVAIVMAFAGAGVWSLVGQVWTVSIVSLVATWVAARWRPAFMFSRATAVRIARYGVNVLGSDLVWNGSNWILDGIVSRMLGLQQLGYLVMANRVVQMTVDTASVAGQQVGVSLFASIKHQRDRLSGAYLTGLSLASSVLMPGLLGLVINAPLLIPGLLGDKWTPAVPLFQLVALAGMGRAVGVVDVPLLLGIGRPRLLFTLRTVTAVLVVSATFVTAQISTVAVAAGYAVVYGLVAPVQLALVSRTLDVNLGRALTAVLPILLISVVASAPAAGVTVALDGVAPPLVAVAASLAVLALAQLLLIRLLRPALWSTATGMLGSLRRRRSRDGAGRDASVIPSG